MNNYVCLLRGINVSGKNILKMAELSELFTSLGFTKVSTYIQSGNVLFCTQNSDEIELEKQIQRGISDRFGLDIKVFVLQKTYLKKVIAECPFPTTDEEDLKHLYFTFLANLSEEVTINVKSTDRWIICEKIIYIWCENGYGKTVFTNTFFEKKLKTFATTRNLATVLKLTE